jgi:hypothetical protein
MPKLPQDIYHCAHFSTLASPSLPLQLIETGLIIVTQTFYHYFALLFVGFPAITALCQARVWDLAFVYSDTASTWKAGWQSKLKKCIHDLWSIIIGNFTEKVNHPTVLLTIINIANQIRFRRRYCKYL